MLVSQYNKMLHRSDLNALEKKEALKFSEHEDCVDVQINLEPTPRALKWLTILELSDIQKYRSYDIC